MGVESEATAKGWRLGRNPEGAKRVEGRGSSYNHTNVAAAPCGYLPSLSGDMSTDPFFGPRPPERPAAKLQVRLVAAGDIRSW